MGLVSWLVDKERRFAWSLAGTVLGMASLAFAYLTTLEKRPEVVFSINNEANVLDVHTPVRDLEVLFRGQNVQQRNLNLRILIVRIENTGDVDILQGQYDVSEPWGFSVSGGRVIEARLVGGNSEYLRRSLQPRQSGERVILAKPILERGKFVTLEVLVLHPKSSKPQIHPFGKIAGIDQLRTLNEIERDDSKTLSSRAFSGTWTIQGIRLLGYTMALVTIAVFFVACSIAVSGILEKRRKYRRGKRLEPLVSEAQSKFTQFFCDLYIKEGEQGLGFMSMLLGNKEQIEITLEHASENPHFFMEEDLYSPYMWIRRLQKMGGLGVSEGKVSIKEGVLEGLREVRSYLGLPLARAEEAGES